jgi:hypothetical protein
MPYLGKMHFPSIKIVACRQERSRTSRAANNVTIVQHKQHYTYPHDYTGSIKYIQATTR